MVQKQMNNEMEAVITVVYVVGCGRGKQSYNHLMSCSLLGCVTPTIADT